MNQFNITIGIDLGTTNSEISYNHNGEIIVLKNIYGDEYTPSVFGFDKSNNKIVGKKSYERLFKDVSKSEMSNHKAEVKRLMGTSEKISFERSGETLLPEEISAEILKSLKADVLRKHPDANTVAAVITVPAYFSTVQSEATRRAGNMAGFEHVVLLQEPIAAAVSYGFLNAQDENWLIYDLGGGTFDVAMISSKDGALTVLGHNGDNFLGGKDFDWLIVEEIIIPELTDKYDLEDFSRNNQKYRTVFAKLKYIAENAKIMLSYDQTVTLDIDDIGEDLSGEEINIMIELSRDRFNELIRPFIEKTLNLVADTHKEIGLDKTHIDKIVLVGGPTQIPYIRERIQDEYNAKIDSSVDPLTSVSRGACIYGMSQKIPAELLTTEANTQEGALALKLNYESLTSETEESISGVIEALSGQAKDHYIQIQAESGLYSSPKVKIRNGKFIETLVLEPHKTNLFWVYVFDDDGNAVPIAPDSFSIAHGPTVSGSPLPHSIGIVLAQKNIETDFATIEVCDRLIDRGTIYPCKSKPQTYKTVRKLEKAKEENPLQIKIVEGESSTPDRNTYICGIGIKGKELPHDLPEGTDVQIIIEVSPSREVSVNAYIPLIDQRFQGRSTMYDEDIDTSILKSDYEKLVERLNRAKSHCTPEEAQRLDNVNKSVVESLANAEHDEDAKRKARKELQDMKIRLDKIDQDKALPQLESEFEKKKLDARDILARSDVETDKKIALGNDLDNLIAEGEQAVAKQDKIMLANVNEQMREFVRGIMLHNPEAWFYMLKQLSDRDDFTNPQEANYYKGKGVRAASEKDNEELKRCVVKLIELLPQDKQGVASQGLSDLRRT